jgi:hypothetical protein
LLTAPALIEKSDAWDEYPQSARSLIDPLKKLVAASKAA